MPSIDSFAATHQDLVAMLSGVGQITTVNKATSQSMSTATVTPVNWDFKRQDDGGWFTLGASTGNYIQVPTAGIYSVTIQISWVTAADTNTAHTYSHHLQVNGTTDSFQSDGNVIAAKEVKIKKWDLANDMHWEGKLNAGDKLTVFVYQDTGASLGFGGWNRPATESANCEFSVRRVWNA